MNEKLKIVFMGTPDFAVPSLKALLADPASEVLAVYTQPDRPAGRGQELQKPPVKIAAEEAGIIIRQPEKLDDTEIVELKKLEPDFIVVVAYGLLLPKGVLDLPKIAAINLHASLLPKFRGASPIQAAILAGEKETGVSFMRMVEKLDAGAVFQQFKIAIGESSAGELFQKLSELGAEKFPEVLQGIAVGSLTSIEQNEDKASFCGKVKKEDGRINWQNNSADLIQRKWRAYSPWPGVFTTWNGKLLKIVEIETSPNPSLSGGEHFDRGQVFESNGDLFVRCVDAAIKLKKLQLEGKRVMEVAEFVRGMKGFVGSRLE